ncbi:MAG: UvrD-helicase domain-containing protein [Deltaproteobacteria bacterium]|nr:UvrD-helicase domain-containing protein [Deltaproteobacteria bacterium]
MPSLEHIFEGLNPEQRQAVEHTDGPLLVLAGAGSGKTRTLTHRIANLIASGKAHPSEILAVTFTNKAAREMRERAERLLEDRARGIWISTFHSACVRILRRDIGHLGYERSFVIYDDSDSVATIRRVLRAMQVDEKAFSARAVRTQIDRLKNRGLLPADLVAEDTLDARRTGEIYQRYQTELRRANALDFGDLILLTVRLFENHPGVLTDYQRRWRYILVDEYQDTNPVQYRLLRLLSAEHRNLCVVGDEDQSIYGFREADIRNILDFEKDFSGAQVIRLERNYRSTQQILNAASAVVANNVERKGKTLFTERTGGEPIRFYEAADERGEAAYVVGEVLKHRDTGGSLGDQAVFYRTHAQSRPLEEELLKYNLPYTVVGGTRFYGRAEIKDALAYLRVIFNPDDTESLVRIINTPTRGIGRSTIERLLQLAEQRETSLYRALVHARDAGQLGGAVAKRVGAFLALLDELSHLDLAGSVAQVLARVLDRSGYLESLERQGSVEAESRLENLRELVSAAEEFEGQNREGGLEELEGESERSLLDLFLEQVTLISEADELKQEEDRLLIMTVHVAKGLEFPIVLMVGMEEGLFPHFASLSDPSALEEERRLCYVGMTRAKDRLYLCNATMRRMFGSVRHNPPSRFLQEIPDEFAAGRPERALGPTSSPSIDWNEGQWEGDELPPIEPGTRVEHPVFGVGTIREVVGSGRNTKIRIRFGAAGLKTIVLRYAQLRLLS